MKDLCLRVNDFRYEIEAENQRQLDKYGVQDHHPYVWLEFASKELGELSNAISEYLRKNGSREDVVEEAVQTATLCIKIAEMFRYLPAVSRGLVGD